MFALVYYKGSKSTDVICQSDYKIKFAVGKTVAVTYNSKPFPGKILFVGTRAACSSKQANVTVGGKLSVEKQVKKKRDKTDVKNVSLPTMTIFDPYKKTMYEDTSEDEETGSRNLSDEPIQQGTRPSDDERLRSPFLPPSIGPMNSVNSSPNRHIREKDINEILFKIHELNGEVMELRENVSNFQNVQENINNEVLGFLKNINNIVMELQMKGRKKYNFSILPEKDVTSVYKLSGGNNRKFALKLEKKIYKQDDPDLLQTIEERIRTADKVNFIMEMVVLYSGLSDSTNRKDVLTACKEALNQRSYRLARISAKEKEQRDQGNRDSNEDQDVKPVNFRNTRSRCSSLSSS